MANLRKLFPPRMPRHRASQAARRASLAAIAAAGLTALAVLAPHKANAILIYTIRQVGSDVVVTGGGSITLAGLTPNGLPVDNITQIKSDTGELGTGPEGIGTPTQEYIGLSSPLSFGTGGLYGGVSFDSASNAVYLCAACGSIFLPVGYSNGNLISSTTIFAGTNIATLGLTSNTSFTWTWGAGGSDQTFQLLVEPAPGPLPALGGAAAFGWSRRLRRRVRASQLTNLPSPPPTNRV